MTLADNALAAPASATFRTGTIDLDIKPLGYSDAGIVLRRRGADSGAFVYIRADPDCPAAIDCIQYVPIAHGLMPWNLYSDRQGPAPIVPTGWNHLHLVVAPGAMAVYVNHEAVPSLLVSPLSPAPGDGIALKGPAIYANLALRPGSGGDLPPMAAPLPAPGTITDWRAAPPTVAAAGGPRSADIPRVDAWTPIAADPASGLVDLGAAFGAAQAPEISTGWLRTTIVAPAPMRRTLRIGWAEQVTVFLNGAPVFRGENQYFPPSGRLSPGGRLEPDNAEVPLDLRRGRNELVLAVGNRWNRGVGGTEASPYGWGAEARLAEAGAISSR